MAGPRAARKAPQRPGGGAGFSRLVGRANLGMGEPRDCGSVCARVVVQFVESTVWCTSAWRSGGRCRGNRTAHARCRHRRTIGGRAVERSGDGSRRGRGAGPRLAPIQGRLGAIGVFQRGQRDCRRSRGVRDPLRKRGLLPGWPIQRHGAGTGPRFCGGLPQCRASRFGYLLRHAGFPRWRGRGVCLSGSRPCDPRGNSSGPT